MKVNHEHLIRVYVNREAVAATLCRVIRNAGHESFESSEYGRNQTQIYVKIRARMQILR